MKKIAYILFLFFTLFFTSCGVRSGYFRLEGKFIHLNQGEFYVYNPDNSTKGFDTIKVDGGRFTYEMPCKDSYTLMLVFPNFSEQPIFAEPGKSVEIKADASHLKEMTVEGTKANELMGDFRKSILNVSPPEEKKLADQFIRDHRGSVVSAFLVRKYFVNTQEPDYAKASELIELMLKEQPKNGSLIRLQQQLKWLKKVDVNKPLPSFTAYDTNGKLVSSTTLASAPVAVIYTWATYSYDSQDLQRELQRKQKKSKGKLQLLSVSVDADKKECKKTLERDSITCPNICDGEMFENKTIQLLGLTALPDNILLQNGKIIGRGMKKRELTDKLDQLLK